MVGGGSDAAFLGHEGVVVLRAAHEGPGESTAQFESLDGRKAPQRLGEVGVQLVEDGFSPAGWDAFGHDRDGASDGVPGFADFADAVDHALGGLRMGTADGGCIHHVRSVVGGCFRHGDVLDALHIGGHGGRGVGQKLLEHLSGDGAGHHPAHGFPCAGPATTTVVAVSILGIVGEIGVARAIAVGEVVIIATACVAVGDREANGGSRGASFMNAGQQGDLVGLFSLGGQGALARPSPVEFGLDPVEIEDDAGGDAIDDAAHGGPVGFTECGQAENGSEGVAGHGAKVRGQVVPDCATLWPWKPDLRADAC